MLNKLLCWMWGCSPQLNWKKVNLDNLPSEMLFRSKYLMPMLIDRASVRNYIIGNLTGDCEFEYCQFLEGMDDSILECKHCGARHE